MWICQKCHRSFKTKNQSHSCVVVQVDSLFLEKPTIIKELNDEVFKTCSLFCKINIDTTLSCIYFADKDRFLVLKPQKTGLILEYVLNRSVDIFPVIKIVQISKKQFAHRLKLECFEDFNDQIKDWIKEAYDLKKT